MGYDARNRRRGTSRSGTVVRWPSTKHVRSQRTNESRMIMREHLSSVDLKGNDVKKFGAPEEAKHDPRLTISKRRMRP